MKTKILSLQTKKHFILLLSFILLLLTSYQSVAQLSCLTPNEYSKQKLRYRSNLNRAAIVQADYRLKIYVHVIRNSDGTGGFSNNEVEEILGYLDAGFNPHQIYFDWDEEIDFIDDDIRAIYGPGFFYDEKDIFSVNNHSDGIDIYLYPGTTLAGAGRANGIGESSEFWVSSTLEQQSAAKTFATAHEMGHVLNLWHTHHGCEESGDWELIDGSNCATAGDFVCDTPADPLISSLDINPSTCEWFPYDLCYPPENIASYKPDTKNIMSYSSINCYEYFSPGQGERMREAIATLPFLQAAIVNVSSAACNMDDWNALKKLYNYTNGDNWKINTNWDILKQDSIPENCSLRGLHGITFDVSGRVTAVNLYNNNLTGSLPDEIGNLTSLQYLDLGFNTIDSTINNQIGKLTELEILFLDNNQFTGSIPLSLLNLKKLGQLTVHNNNLSGCFDVQFGAWCGQFSANSFSVEGDNNKFNTSFDLFCENGNGICAIERCDIEDWRTLKQFYKSTNGDDWTDNLNWETVTGNLPPVDCDLRKLRGVSLNVEGKVMALDLFDNNLTGSLPDETGDLTELTYIDLGYNLIGDTIPPALGKLDKLNTLLLDNNNFTGNIPGTFADMENLSILYLNNNNLTGCPNADLANLCTKLIKDYNKNEYISEGNNLNIDWEIFCEFGIDSCKIPTCEADWFALKQLYINTNGDNWDINDGWETIIEGSPPLENCNLNLLFGVETDDDGNVTNIDLHDNNLTGILPTAIGNFSNLKDLLLYDNQISGNIPPEIGNLSNLEDIRLFRNELSGEIPSTVGKLMNIQVLYFDYNQLTGTIPVEFGNLINSIDFGLSNNLLTGTIPGEFGNFSNLETLFLFNNNLSGCYNSNLTNLCGQIDFYYFYGEDIDFGNNFDALWADFCTTSAGTCEADAAICNSIPELIIDGLQFEAATYHSAQKISSNAIIEAETIFKAGETIELLSGFETNGLNDFQLLIEDCE